MKNISRYLFFSAVAIAAAGCTADDSRVDELAAGFTLDIVPSDVAAAVPDVRTGYDTELRNIVWDGSESMRVYFDSGEYDARIVMQEGGAHFPVRVAVEEPGTVSLSGVVPLSAVVAGANTAECTTLRLSAEQNGATVATFDPAADILAAKSAADAVITAEDIEAGGKRVDFQFGRTMAVSRYAFEVLPSETSADEIVESVTLTVEAGAGNEAKLLTGDFRFDLTHGLFVDGSGNTLSPAAPFVSGNDYVRTTFAPDVRPTLGELVFWPVTAAVTLEAGDRMVFTVVTDAHEIVKTVTLSRELTYTVASLNKASVGLAGAEVRTRDMVTDLSAGGTANSYAVGRAAAKYKFRADVKGNGRALDCGTLSYGEDDLRIEPKGALVLWYTCVQTACTPWEQRSPIVLDAVSCKDGYIYFETPEEFVNGNVVIVALDKALAYDEVEADAENRIANAEVLWSWNIIASEGYDIDAPENCIVKGGYTIMGRDLGAVLDYSDVYKGSWAATNHFEMASVGGNFYQWGRKDPFPTFPDYESLAAGGYTGLRFTPTYTPIPALNRGSFGLPSPNRQASDQIFGTDNGTVAISYTGSADSEFAAQAVQNPHLWLYKGNCWNKDMSFWGNPTAGTERKTIYDPCPPGWKIWSKNAWLALTDGQTAEFVTTDRGLMLDGKWYFPLCGARSSWGEVMGYHGPCGVKIPAQYVVSDAEYSNWACHVAVEAEVNFQPGSTNVTYTTTGNWIGTNNYTDRGARVRCIRDDE